jgi:hypothetical protein
MSSDSPLDQTPDSLETARLSAYEALERMRSELISVTRELERYSSTVPALASAVRQRVNTIRAHYLPDKQKELKEKIRVLRRSVEHFVADSMHLRTRFADEAVGNVLRKHLVESRGSIADRQLRDAAEDAYERLYLSFSKGLIDWLGDPLVKIHVHCGEQPSLSFNESVRKRESVNAALAKFGKQDASASDLQHRRELKVIGNHYRQEIARLSAQLQAAEVAERVARSPFRWTDSLAYMMDPRLEATLKTLVLAAESLPVEIKRINDDALSCLNYGDNEFSRAQLFAAVEQRVQNAIRLATSIKGAKSLNNIAERYHDDDGTYECEAILSYQRQCLRISEVLPRVRETRQQTRNLLSQLKELCDALWALPPSSAGELKGFAGIWGQDP